MCVWLTLHGREFKVPPCCRMAYSAQVDICTPYIVLPLQMEQSFGMQIKMGMAQDGESDELKRVFLEGNPYLLVGRCVNAIGRHLPLLHCLRTLLHLRRSPSSSLLVLHEQADH